MGGAEAAERSLAELAALAETAGSEVLDGVIQRRDRPDPATYVGSGKVAEIRELVSPHRGGHGDLRWRALAEPAAKPRAEAQDQGR
ncbi:MAG: hypothetical protein WKF47_04360 [Geodermatophilaceae bacterium]